MTGTKLVAGLLTAAALTAFADNRATAQTPAPNIPRSSAHQMVDQDSPVMGLTKDGKRVNISVSVKAINPGKMDPGVFDIMLSQLAKAQVLGVMTQYNEADIPANIDKIQKAIGEGVSKMAMLGIGPDGKPQYAQPGVNFATPTVVKVTEFDGGKVVFEQKAPATKPAAAPKA